MTTIPTPHIEANEKALIAKTVLMPGDPLRAKFIADTFLSDVITFNTTRNMFGYTGYYKGKKISVMGSGMGMASIGIYSYELYNFYDVENIVRIGSAGSYSPRLNVYDVVLVTEAWSESTFAKVMGNINKKILKSNTKINTKLKKAALKLGIEMKEARIHSSDVFYHTDSFSWEQTRDKYGVEAVEMESFALFANAMISKKNASCILTISDSFITHEITSSLERQNAFTNMMEIALSLAAKE